MWKRGGVVGRLTLNFGMVFWFWLGALDSVFSSPPFPTPEKLYLGFASVVPNSVVATGLICVNLFALMCEIGWQQLPQPHKILAKISGRVDPKSVTWIDFVSLGLALLGWIPIFLTYRGDLVTAFQDLLRMRAGGQVGGSQQVGLANHLHLLGLFGGALAIARTVLKSRGFPVARYFAAGVCLPLVFLGSSRFNLAFLFLPALLILIAPLRHLFRWDKRRNTPLAITLLFGSLIIFQGAVRTVGLGGRTRARDRSMTEKLTSGWVGHDHFGAMLIAIDLVDASGGFFFEPIEPFFVTHFIPRQIWKDKPYPVSWKKYNEAVTRGFAFNVTPSITGQYYMNWSYFGVVYIGLVMGWLSRLCELWFARLDIQHQLMSRDRCRTAVSVYLSVISFFLSALLRLSAVRFHRVHRAHTSRAGGLIPRARVVDLSVFRPLSRGKISTLVQSRDRCRLDAPGIADF